VHRALQQEREHGRPDVGPAAAAAATPAAALVAPAGTAEAGAALVAEGEAGREAEAAQVGLVQVAEVSVSHDYL
jgi:hypothetical protein